MTVLERLKNRITYKELDKDALEISRACAAGSLGKKDDYAEWAMLTNDPLVVVNYVKTFITTLVSKMSSCPFVPENEALADIGVALRLNAVFTQVYEDVLNDGYAFLGVGMDHGTPQVRTIDARYIMYNGDDPTLRDATDVVVFQVLPKDKKDWEHNVKDFPTGYVDYNASDERVVTSYYHKVKVKDEETGEKVDRFVLDVYEYYDDEPKRYELKGIDRVPVVRFVGERIELSDKRYHYRGIYYQMSSVLKALTLSGTKIQIRAAASDDDNYFVSSDSIANHKEVWKNSGAKEYDDTNDNGGEIAPPTPIPHDNEFLLNAFNMWKGVISDMLGPVVQSGSEAVTREEVIARNEVRDALTNSYMTRMVDSISEVYRCINMLQYGDTTTVVVLGGYIEEVKRTKNLQELEIVYGKAKDAGLNLEGFIEEYVQFTTLPTATKEKILGTIKTDPYASPKVRGMQVQLQQKDEQIRKLQMEKAILQLKASTRAEHQNEYISMLERNNNAELELKRWTEEQKQTQEARMEVLRTALQAGDTATALALLDAIQQVDPVNISTAAVEDVTVADNVSTEQPITPEDQARIDNQTMNPAQPSQPGVM